MNWSEAFEKHLTEFSATDQPATSKLQSFLDNNKPTLKPPIKPFFTRDFYIATISSLLYLALFSLGIKYGGTEQLGAWLKQDMSASTNCEQEYLHAGLFKKQCVADSAVFLNNEAVDTIQRILDNTSSESFPLLWDANQQKVEYADNVLKKAIEMRPNYGLAKLNFAKLNYDLGCKPIMLFTPTLLIIKDWYLR